MYSIVFPSIADLRVEYSEAVRQGRLASALWIRVRASWDFVRMPEPHPVKLASTCGQTNSASTVKAQGSTVIKT